MQYTPHDIITVAQAHAKDLHSPVGVDPVRLLCALAVVESSFGLDCVPRFERAYAPTGRYFHKEMIALYREWGAWACCSYGPWQILYDTAYVAGYRGSPADLWTPDGSIPWVVRVLNVKVSSPIEETVEQIADAWNSGNFRDSVIPTEYIKRVRTAYQRADLLTVSEVA